MRVGDLVQSCYQRKYDPHYPHYMYSAPPGNRSTIEVATSFPWREGDIGIILEIQDDFIRIVTQTGHTGWVHTSWVVS